MDIIKINVGGTRFETTRSTLMKSKYFEAMLMRWNDNKNEIFVDRDPDNFREILKLLRDDNHVLKKNIEYELDFYQIDINKNQLYVPYTEKNSKYNDDETYEKLNESKQLILKKDHTMVDVSATAAIFKIISTDAKIKIYDINTMKNMIDYSEDPPRNCFIRLIDESSSNISNQTRKSDFNVVKQGDIIKEFIIEVDDWKAIDNISYYLGDEKIMEINNKNILLLCEFSKDPNILVIPVNMVSPSFQRVWIEIEHNNTTSISVSSELLLLGDSRRPVYQNNHMKQIMIYDTIPSNDFKITGNKLKIPIKKAYPYVTKIYFCVYYNDELIGVKNMQIITNNILLINCNESYLKYKMTYDTDMTYYYKFEDSLYTQRIDSVDMILHIDELEKLDPALINVNVIIEYYNIIYSREGILDMLYLVK